MSETLLLRGATVLDPGAGSPASEASVLVADGRIAQVGATLEAPAGARVVDLAGKTLMPALIDAHFHLTMHQGWGPMSAQVRLTDEFLIIRGVRAALRAVRDGILTIRELGANHGTNLPLKKAIAARAIPGPRTFTAGTPIGVPGGHAWMVTPQCTGEQQFAAAVRTQVRDGADWIKLFISEEGLFGRPGDPASAYSRPDVSAAELRAAVATAHDMRTPVSVHANHHEAIERALDAGVDSVEHGICLTPELAARMAEQGTWLVPTINIYRQIANPAWGRGGVHGEMASAFREAHMQACASAIEAGVRIGVGSDSAGDIVDDLRLIAECGMPTLDALRAVTLGNAELLGIEHEVGRVAAGYAADLIVLDGDPARDLGALKRIDAVIQGGDMRAPAEIGLRTDDETADWNTAVLAAGGPAGNSPY